MKIKRIFGLASICSLAVLMTACGKKSENENLVNKDILSSYSTPLSELKESFKPKTKVVTVFEDKQIVKSEGYMVIAEDDDKYYVYNLKLEDKLVLTLEKEDMTSISIEDDLIICEYPTNELGDEGYAAYFLDGTPIYEKAFPGFFNTYEEGNYEIQTDISSSYTVYTYSLRYQNFHDGEYEDVTVYYYVVKEEDLKGIKFYYLKDNEFEEKYGKSKEYYYDGGYVGLDGYTLRNFDGKVYIYKKGKIVNVFKTLGSAYVMSNGCALYQSVKKVGKNDRYDFFLDGEYYVVKTYSYDYLTSKVTEVKNFKYYIKSSIMPYVTENENGNIVVSGSICSVYDFSSTKELDSGFKKVALIKGNGKISIHERLQFSGDRFVQDGDKYYDYFIGDLGSTTTVEYSSKGEIKDVYYGIYYDGITVETNKAGSGSFKDATGKTLMTITNINMVNLSKYTGKDSRGNKVFVEIKNGAISVVNMKGYEVIEDGALYLHNEETNMYELYSYDSTLTKIDFEYEDTATVQKLYYDSNTEINYYTITDASGIDMLVYFE
ncbi:MAG: hypothetical protein J6Y28_05100 [Acholeplasmatales bacterium]|nr:hypothetical protein [Acholeplasmatales bacterium]